MRTALLLVVAFSAASCATTSSATKPAEAPRPAEPTPTQPQPTPTKATSSLEVPQRDEWLSLTLRGQKIGFLHTTLGPGVWNGTPVRLSVDELVFAAKSGGKALRFEKAFSLDDPGKLIGFKYDEQNDDSRENVVGTCEPDALVLVTKRPNAPDDTQRLAPCRETVAGSYLAQAAATSRSTVQAFVMSTPTEDRLTKAIFLTDATLNSVAGDVPVAKIRMDESLYFIARDGRTLKVEYAPGMSGVASTEPEAKNIGNVDVAALTEIRPARPFSPAIQKAPAQAVVVIANIDKSQVPDVPNRQSVEQVDAHRVRLTIRSHVPLAKNLDPKWLKDPSAAPTAIFDSNHPTVTAFAKTAVGAEKNAWLAAQKLAAAVVKTVESRQGMGAERASDILAAGRGTRPALNTLFIAAARATGIPAKEVTGLALIGEVLYPTTWAEIFVGEWISVDPSVDGLLAAPDHIVLRDINVIMKGDLWIDVVP